MRWYSDPMTITGIGVSALVLLGVVCFIAWKCWENKRGVFNS